MSTVPLTASETFNRKFATRRADATIVQADALPVVTVYRNGVATAIVVTVTPLSPIEYDTSFTVPSDAVITDSWQYLIEATIDGVAVTAFVQLSQFLTAGDLTERAFTLRDGSGFSIPADVTSPESLTAVVVRNNVDEATVVTIAPDSSPDVGRYVFTFTNGAWAVGDEISVRINATIRGVIVERLWYLGQISNVAATQTVGALIVEADTQDISVEDVAPDISVEDVPEDITVDAAEIAAQSGELEDIEIEVEDVPSVIVVEDVADDITVEEC